MNSLEVFEWSFQVCMKLSRQYCTRVYCSTMYVCTYFEELSFALLAVECYEPAVGGRRPPGNFAWDELNRHDLPACVACLRGSARTLASEFGEDNMSAKQNQPTSTHTCLVCMYTVYEYARVGVSSVPLKNSSFCSISSFTSLCVSSKPANSKHSVRGNARRKGASSCGAGGVAIVVAVAFVAVPVAVPVPMPASEVGTCTDAGTNVAVAITINSLSLINNRWWDTVMV